MSVHKEQGQAHCDRAGSDTRYVAGSNHWSKCKNKPLTSATVEPHGLLDSTMKESLIEVRKLMGTKPAPSRYFRARIQERPIRRTDPKRTSAVRLETAKSGRQSLSTPGLVSFEYGVTQPLGNSSTV